MKIPGGQCPRCGTIRPTREVADDEVCACASRMCLLSSADICITTNRPRTGTFRRSALAPPQDAMVRQPALKK